MNYIDLVNNVLRRLRETEVTSVASTAYSKMIGEFVNDAKRQVEDAYNWNCLSNTLTASTSAALFSYSLVGSGQRFKVIDVLNDTKNNIVSNVSTQYMNQLFLLGNGVQGSPTYYNFNGTDDNGDTMIDLYPIPDGVYDIRVNIIQPQPALSGNTDDMLVPYEPVIFLAYAKALAERGEDSGIFSNEAYSLFQQSLADAIAIESNRYVEEQEWISI